MPGLWKNTEESREGKYLVQRRDGTIPEWPFFVIAASDPAAPKALHTYAEAAAEHGMDPEYVRDVAALAAEFSRWRAAHSPGDPDAPRHRVDDPAIVAKMREGLAFEFTQREGEPLTLETAVFETLGYVSMCWSDAPTGVFDSTRAKVAGELLVQRIRRGDLA